MADITNELNIIANDVYGKNVKQAIYDALVKVNGEGPSPGPSGADGFFLGTALLQPDGGVYYTQGTAELDAEVVDLLEEPYVSALSNKNVDDYNGTINSGTVSNRVVCETMIEIPQDVSAYTVNIVVSGASATGQYICYFYDANDEYLYSESQSGWSWSSSNSGTIKQLGTARKVRPMIRVSTNADINISNISTFNMMFY